MKPVLPAARVLLLVAGLFAAAACTRKSDTQTADALRLADREAIEATMHRYLRGLDHVDANLYASTFAPDGLLDINGDLREGRDAMKAIIEEEVALRQAMRDRGQPPRVLFHLETNTRIEFPEAGSALRTAYWMTLSRVGKDPGGLSTIGVGSSTDELRRIDGQWLIARRTISMQP